MSVRVRFRHLAGPEKDRIDDVRLPALLGSAPEADVRRRGRRPAPRPRLRARRRDRAAGGRGRAGAAALRRARARGAAARGGRDRARLPTGPGCGSSPPTKRAGRCSWPRPGRAPARSRRRRAFVARSLGQISPPMRWILGLALVLSLAALGYSQLQDRRLRQEVERLREALRESEREREAFAARIAEERARAETARSALATRLEELREREEALYAQLRDAHAAESGALRGELDATRTRLATLESERAVGERIIREYGPGVCLIQGTYGLQRRRGPAAALQARRAGQLAQGRRRQPAARPRGAGPGARGRVLRHRLPGGAARPRAHQPPRRRALVERRLRELDARARLHAAQTVLRAFFPREKRPFGLRAGAPRRARGPGAAALRPGGHPAAAAAARPHRKGRRHGPAGGGGRLPRRARGDPGQDRRRRGARDPDRRTA